MLLIAIFESLAKLPIYVSVPLVYKVFMALRVKVFAACVVALLALLLASGCKNRAYGKTVVCRSGSLASCGGAGGRYSDWLAKWLPNGAITSKGVERDTLVSG